MDIPAIGPQHSQIRLLRHVINNATAERRRLFVAEGLWAHTVLLEQHASIDTFFWCPQAATSAEAHAVSRRIAERAGQAYRISARLLERFTEREEPNGLLSLVTLPQWQPDTVTLRPNALVLVADGIELPGNLGTMLRTLDACAGDCLVLTNRRTRLSHPKVFHSSRGMSLRVPVIDLAEPARAMRWLGQRGFSVYLATPDAAAIAYHEVPFAGRTAIVVGNEKRGVCPGWFEHGLTPVAIPMLGEADSLNVSVCASILLYTARARLDEWSAPARPGVAAAQAVAAWRSLR